MLLEKDGLVCHVPTLVSYCQRVASVHANAIASLGDGGDGLRFDLIKPILENCSPENLLRLESTSPHIKSETLRIWKDVCFRAYPLIVNDLEEPESWRDQYFVLKGAEAKRIEEVGSRLRNRRAEAGEKKKEREVKMTDRLPPAKRIKWGSSAQPMTLLQKTRLEASKIQRAVHSSYVVPKPTAQQRQVLRGIPSLMSATPATTEVSSRVTVHTVTYRRPSSPVSSSASTLSLSATSPKALTHGCDYTKEIKQVPHLGLSTPAKDPLPESPTPPKAVRPSKKDPLYNMFMPARHKHSQLS